MPALRAARPRSPFRHGTDDGFRPRAALRAFNLAAKPRDDLVVAVFVNAYALLLGENALIVWLGG